jgi:hypothetical protein
MGIFDITNLKNKNKIGQSQNRYVVTMLGDLQESSENHPSSHFKSCQLSTNSIFGQKIRHFGFH